MMVHSTDVRDENKGNQAKRKHLTLAVPPLITTRGHGKAGFSGSTNILMKAGFAPETTMSRICAASGKKPTFGNNVSHANNKTRRRFMPNLQVCSFPSEILGTSVAMRLTANGIRTVEHKGGLDAWLLGTRDSRLGTEALKVKKRLLKVQAAHAKKA